MNDRNTRDLRISDVLIATHEVFEDGAPQALEKYLAVRSRSVEILLFPFKGVPDERVGRRVHRGGRLVSGRRYRFSAPMPNEMVAWVRDMLVLMARLTVVGRRIDLFVGVDPMNCLVGVVMKKLGLLRAPIVFYTIDYVPKRFGNERLNALYHRIDEFCCSNVQTIWNVSAEIAVARRERSGSGRRAPQVVVPIGVHSVVQSPQKEPVARLVYLGILLEKQGLQYVVPVLRQLAGDIPGLHLDIVGSGPYEGTLRELIDQHGVGDLVTFRGYVKENADIIELLSLGGVGLAVYDDDPNSFTRFADPSKLKAYLASGLPILLTDVPAIAPVLVEKGCAVIVEPQPASIAAGVMEVLGDASRFRAQAQAAVTFARGLSWTHVFDAAFSESGWGVVDTVSVDDAAKQSKSPTSPD